jgi:Domain of Unknown Function (DUF1206)
MHSTSIAGVTHEARRASDSPAAHLLARAGLTARGVIYILIGWVALLVAVGHSSREADQQGALQLLAGKSYGVASLWLLGQGFAAYALWRLGEAAFGVTGEPPGAGARLKSLGRALIYAGFMRYLRTSQMSLRTRRVVELLGLIGTIARGLVFALAGALVVDAAVSHRASESGGIDKALLTLRNQPFGEILMILAALGLAAFGIFGLCEARWRRV